MSKTDKVGKIYWTNIDPIGCNTPKYMVYFFIPRIWWSIKEWKLALNFRKNFYLTGMYSCRSKEDNK